MDLKIETLNNRHHKKKFNCGNSLLDNYIQKQAKQDVNRDLAACFVLTDLKTNNVIGYYTLSANSLNREDFPSNIIRNLPPSYQELPTILLGRLAIDSNFKGNGYGEIILIDALNRCVDISGNMGTLAVIVDPIDDKAMDFYWKYGFILIPYTGKMFIPIKTIENSK